MTTREDADRIAEFLHDAHYEVGSDWPNVLPGVREHWRRIALALIESGLLNDQRYEQVGWVIVHAHGGVEMAGMELFTSRAEQFGWVPVFRRVDVPGETP